jgi:hypothetical protein
MSARAESCSTSPTEPTTDDQLARKLAGSLLAEELRRLADRSGYEQFRAHVLSCVNSVLIDAARTPDKDRARVLKALHEFGGGTVADVAEQTKLTPAEARRYLAELCTSARIVVRRRTNGDGHAVPLYFLPDDPTRLDYAPP